jgi:hypothetical protein
MERNRNIVRYGLHLSDSGHVPAAAFLKIVMKFQILWEVQKFWTNWAIILAPQEELYFL